MSELVTRIGGAACRAADTWRVPTADSKQTDPRSIAGTPKLAYCKDRATVEIGPSIHEPDDSPDSAAAKPMISEGEA